MQTSVHGSFVEEHDSHSHQFDPLLAEVFSAVQLPPVRHEELRENGNKDERDAVLAELDQVLKTQRSLSESSNETPTLNHHLAPSRSRNQSILSEHGREHHITPALDVALEHTNGIAPTLSERSESLDSEDADVFPSDGVIQRDIAALRYIQQPSRSRSATIDSQVSAAESRFGTFDLQDDSGRYKGSQINLYHDEVAYIRPKSRKMTVESEKTTVVKTPSLKRDSVNEIKPSVRRISEAISRRTTMNSISGPVIDEGNHYTDKANDNVVEEVHVYEMPPVYGQEFESTHRASISTLSIEENGESDHIFNDILTRQLESGHVIKELNEIGIIRPAFQEFYHGKFRHFVVGDRKQMGEEEKVVLLVGNSGVGKTTFVYSALNYLYGVEKDYDFRFAFESPDEIAATNGINMYSFRHTVWDQVITFVDTPGIENEDTLPLISDWIKFRLNKKAQLKIDGLLVFTKDHDRKYNAHLASQYKKLERVLGDDIRTLTIPICMFDDKYKYQRNITNPNLPFPSEEGLLFSNSGFFPNLLKNQSGSSLQHYVCYKASCSSFDELLVTLTFKLHPVVLAVR
ncbi:hypothetical protein M3Y94_00312700 [Aphelenchoides besseyi]|nr:hypothetical protein M3Y94_00312700 [Aphelenchoides besseyi]KAI6235719.1 G domain-containing protein [Aphelenchoides besseyi]